MHYTKCTLFLLKISFNIILYPRYFRIISLCLQFDWILNYINYMMLLIAI